MCAHSHADGGDKAALDAAQFVDVFRDSVAVLPASKFKSFLLRKQLLYSARLIQYVSYVHHRAYIAEL